MGRPEEQLKRDGSPEREFAFWLRDLRNHAGLTYERLARAANYSTSTMQAAAAGRQLPTLKVTMAFVAACHGDQALWETYWTQVKRALDNDSPEFTGWPVKPPWAPAPAAMTRAARQPAPSASLRITRPHPRHLRAHPAPGPAVPAAAVPAPASPAAATPVAGTPVAQGPEDSKDGWYVESFAASLRLDTPQPEAIEDRVIVATMDGLREIATSISVPRRPGDSAPEHRLSAELVYGGSLRLSEQPYESYFRNVISLAKPLKSGEHHEYRLLIRIPPGQAMTPHYIYMPFQRTDRFSLRVRFNPQRLPKSVRALRGTPPVVIYEDQPDGTVLTPDRFGEINIEFRNIRLGLGYGVFWQE
jgi:DNA-binding XRE family transcriptional regulator